MEYSLTKPEMDAVLQLIQLRGNSEPDFQFMWVDFGGKNEEKITEEEETNKEESVGETSSSSSKSVIYSQDAFWEEVLPRRREKLRAIVDIYGKTGPLIKNRRGYKRRNI